MKNKNKNKKIFNALLTLCAALVLMGGFSVTAYAQTPEGQDDATDDSGVVYEEPEKEEPLTPDGNATLVDDFVCKDNMTACSGKEAEPETEEPAEQPEKKNNTGGLLVFLIVALLGGGGAAYYFKVMKPKQDVKGGTDLDDFDFDDYDEDEPEPDETGDGGGTEDEEA